MNPTLDHSLTALGTLARNPGVFLDTCVGTGITQEEIGRLAYRRAGCGERDNIIWQGLSVRPGDLQFRQSKLCLACYLERGYALAEWDHVATLACPKHRVLLDDACPCCGSPWTPDGDPLACGCSPAAMVVRQHPCSERTASTMQHIIEAADQEALNTINRLWRVIGLWSELGMPLTKSEVADALAELSRSEWPRFQGYHGCAQIHPRVALAPLLAATEPESLKMAQSLLSKAMPVAYMSPPAEVRWPASVAQKVLGTGAMPFGKLVDAGHIAADSDGRFFASSINDLLWLVAGSNNAATPLLPLQVLRGGQHRKSMATLVSMIKSGDITEFHCDARRGLSDLHCALNDRPVHLVHDGIGIHDAAFLLGTNAESLRRAIQAGLLPAVKGTRTSAIQWIIPPQALEAFDAKFVFASAVARRHETSVTTIASRLRSAGLVPVSGPGIDGGATFVFHSEDLENIDLPTVLSGSYISPAGRKKATSTSTSATPDQPTGKEVACELGISIRQLREVVRIGWISPSGSVARRQVFKLEDVFNLKHRLGQDFVTLGVAAQQVGQTEAQFQKTWITTEVVRCHRFARRKLIERADLDRVLAIWGYAGSASSIGTDLKRRRWLCPNLTKMGQLPEVTQLGSGTRKVRLYPRSAPVLQHYAPPGSVRAGLTK